jgi:hypothetical protein
MKNVFVTGASSGIGAQLVRLLAGRGLCVGTLALQGDELTAAAEMARAAGASDVHAYGVDVRDRAAVRAAVADFVGKAGGLDLFVGCAGVDFDVPIDAYDSERAEFIFDVNLNGLMYGVNAALEVMLKQPSGGQIVGIASLAGWRILPTHADYSASKSAVDAYLESLRIRLRGRRIDVMTVSPGFVRTPMTANHPYPMPFAVEAQDAARRILRGIDRRKDHIAFPWPYAWGMRLLRAMPDVLWRLLLRLMGKV